MAIRSLTFKLPPKDKSENVSTGTMSSGTPLKMGILTRKTSGGTKE